jgi:hypothetical protein
MRDQRDPQKLGELLLSSATAARGAYGADIPITEVYDVHVRHIPVEPYSDGGHISSDPAKHHSKVDQTPGNLDDGGSL